ncbi:GRAM domain-containing protein 1B [Armadillidium vulgare]|nr:GRAM domain-containing protein 1B [Armadillidium vulgare]
MPGVLCQENCSKHSLGMVVSNTDIDIERLRNCSESSDINSDEGLSSLSPPRSLVCCSESEQNRCFNMTCERKTRNLPALPALLLSRNTSLSRSDLIIERRMSLEPVVIRSRSHSQPPTTPHSAPADNSGMHLAEAALHNALATCALSSVQIGQSRRIQPRMRNKRHPIFSPSSAKEDSCLDSKSSFTKLQKSSSSPPSPSPGLISHYSSPPSPGEIEIPTDLSDTVESEPDKEKIIGTVPELVVCPNIATHHLGREVTNAVYGLPIDTLFTLLFTNSKFMFDIYAGRKTYAFSKPSEIYTIDAEASNSGIPYADSFYVSNHWCLTRESLNETRLALWSQVKYKKNVWGFMKNVIDKNAFSGMESFMSDLNCSLLREVDKTNLKRTKRRRRRAGSKGNDISDPLHVPLPIISSIDIHKSTQIPSRKLTLPSIVTESKNRIGGSSIKSVTLFFLCALLVVNAFLYYRLYSLEERVISNVSLKDYGIDAATLNGPNGDKILIEEWVQILRHQEVLHAEELERWRAVIMEAANYLQKAEESLRNLHSSIPNKQASKMQALLSRLQRLQERQEQKHKTKPNSNSAGNSSSSSSSSSTIVGGENPKDFKPSVEL